MKAKNIKWITRDEGGSGDIYFWNKKPVKNKDRESLEWLGKFTIWDGHIKTISLNDFKQTYGFILKPGEIRKVKEVVKLVTVK